MDLSQVRIKAERFAIFRNRFVQLPLIAKSVSQRVLLPSGEGGRARRERNRAKPQEDHRARPYNRCNFFRALGQTPVAGENGVVALFTHFWKD